MIGTSSDYTTAATRNSRCASTVAVHALVAAALCAALALGATGCRVQTEKSANGEDKTVKVETPFGSIHTEKGENGEDKNVKIDTPIGGLHVNTDQTKASDLGLPEYPGAQIVTDKENDKSADVNFGFGNWKLSLKAVNYATADSRDQVTAFYKKALGRYGDVISCSHNKPVGAPAVTSEGLTCADGTGGAQVKVGDGDLGSGSDGIELKAGSKHHQHIVGFDNSSDGKAHFTLVEVELPSSLTNSGKSD